MSELVGPVGALADRNGFNDVHGLLFSRSAIPYNEDKLVDFYRLPESHLRRAVYRCLSKKTKRITAGDLVSSNVKSLSFTGSAVV